MGTYRTPTEKSKYYMPKEEYLTVIHFCRQYPAWLAELDLKTDPSRAITYDGDKVQTSNQRSTTEDLAIRRVQLSGRVDLVEDTAKETDAVLWEWLIMGACYGYPFYKLLQMGIPCGKDLYYELRQRFYYGIGKRL